MARQTPKARKSRRKAARRAGTDRVGQIVAILATVMAASYIVIRAINWVRFL